MKITNQKKTPPSFKAREFATIKTKLSKTSQELRIFEIDDRDTCFLDLMASKIDLSKLANIHNATNQQIRRWKNIIDNAILMSGFNEPQKSFLLVKEKKPCGILTFKESVQEANLDYISMWPVSCSETVKLAGKSLIKILFNNALKNKTKKITLAELANSPVDINSFYKSVGFVENKSPSIDVTMSITSDRIKKYSRELDKLIKIKRAKNSSQVDLKKILDINY